MQTVTIANTDVELHTAQATFSGYGHYKITVELYKNNEFSKFTATTNNMPAFDEAKELEGEEKELALFNIIDYKIEDEVAEWLENI